MADLRKLLDEATPGPWVFGRTGEEQRLILGGPSKEYVANVQIFQTPRNMGAWQESEREANARLIALAPQLAAALIKAREGLEGIERTYYTEGKDAVWRSVHMRAISSATLAEIDALMGGKDD